MKHVSILNVAIMFINSTNKFVFTFPVVLGSSDKFYDYYYEPFLM